MTKHIILFYYLVNKQVSHTLQTQNVGLSYGCRQDQLGSGKLDHEK